MPFVIKGGLHGVGIGVIWIPHYPAAAPTRVTACPVAPKKDSLLCKEVRGQTSEAPPLPSASPSPQQQPTSSQMPAALVRRLRAALRPLQLGVQRTPRRALAAGSQERGEPLAPATLGVHADAPGPPRDGGGASGEPRLWSHDRDIAPPIGVTTTFEAAGDDGHVYSRQSTPTRDRCESVLAALEATPGSAAPHALLYSSGLAACHAILVALAPSAARLAISGGYHGTHQVIDILTELRTELEIIELPAAQEAAAVLRSGDIVWLESPRNPMCEVYDIAAYSSLSCKPAVVVDGTFAPPPVQRALSHGATAVMHSTTKCPTQPPLPPSLSSNPLVAGSG